MANNQIDINSVLNEVRQQLEVQPATIESLTTTIRKLVMVLTEAELTNLTNLKNDLSLLDQDLHGPDNNISAKTIEVGEYVEITGELAARMTSDTLAVGALTVKDGKVGVGSPEPLASLHVEGPTDSGIRVSAPGKNTSATLQITDEDHGHLFLGGETHLRGNGGESSFDGPVTVAGAVAIGTTIASGQLTVSGGDIRIEGGKYRRLKIVSDDYWSGIELVARQKTEQGHPHIDFTHGDAVDSPNFGVRVHAETNTELVIGARGAPAKLRVSGDISASGAISADGTISAGTILAKGAITADGKITAKSSLFIEGAGSELLSISAQQESDILYRSRSSGMDWQVGTGWGGARGGQESFFWWSEANNHAMALTSGGDLHVAGRLVLGGAEMSVVTVKFYIKPGQPGRWADVPPASDWTVHQATGSQTVIKVNDRYVKLDFLQ